MSSPPAKRKRTETSDITRSKIYFEDGNVVLEAGNTKHWRVHKGVLSHKSTVFSGMLQKLPPSPSQRIVDGCPVLALSNDHQDVEYLMKALYDPSFHCKKVLPFPIVRALIRLGRQYRYEYLYESGLDRIRTEFPSTLEKYDEATNSYQTIEPYNGLSRDILSLASEDKILSVLPGAYYNATKFGLEELLRGIERPDGTMSFLSTADLTKCLLAREKIFVTQFQPGYTLGWARRWEFGGCTTPAKCRAEREGILAMYMDAATVDALMKPGDLEDHGLCLTCTTTAHECIRAGRKRMWDELPTFFGLPPWDRLNTVASILSIFVC
ncbi:BTB domain-containing protein [Favolaschia claudopus]|uniref:BTB domain-containing protein n=1 Tax=Favolaschia claudopus TaxID=2862362 RepID=A0AAW0BH03_9AGAR